MLNARLNKALVAFLAVVAAGACDDAPIDPGSTDAARLTTNPSYVVIEAGDSRVVQMFLVNDAGNAVAGNVSFEACNNLITVTRDEAQTDLEPGTNIVITGNTLGESCVNASAGGFERTIRVVVVPASVGVSAVDDTVRAGATGSIDVFLANETGGSVGPFSEEQATFTSSDTLKLFFTDNVGNFDTRVAGGVNVTVTYTSFGVTRSVVIPITVLPAPAVSGAFQSNYGAIAFGDTVVRQVILRDSINNINDLDSDIDSIQVTSSNTAVAVAWGMIEQDRTFPDRVDLNVYVEGAGPGSATISATVFTSNGAINAGSATVTVLSPTVAAVTPNSGAPGSVVVISGAGLQATGFTTQVFMGATDITMFVDQITPTAITLDMPAAPVNGNQNITVRVGGVASNAVTWNQTTMTDAYAPGNTDMATAPNMPFPIDLVGTFVGSNDEDWYQYTIPVRSAMVWRLDWTGSKDLDILFFNAAGQLVCSVAGASSAHPENATCTQNAGTYWVYVNDYSNSHDGDQALVTYELRGTATPAP